MTYIPPINSADIQFVGHDLHRPECVLCFEDRTIVTADWRGGVVVIEPDQTQKLIIADKDVAGEQLKPNGIAADRDGSFIIAHFSDKVGGVFRLNKSGALAPILTELGGRPLPPANFVLIDDKERIWVTISTKLHPRHLSWTPDHADGFIILIDQNGPRIVAENLGFTNELRLDENGEFLYVVETFSRRVSRYRIADDGSLSGREVFVQFGAGTFPDGLAFDAEQGLWVTGVFADRLIRVTPEGCASIMFEGQASQDIDKIERAFQAGDFAGGLDVAAPTSLLGNVSSISFGGPDLKTAYLGSLSSDKIAKVQVSVAGVPLNHWEYRSR